MNKKLDKIKQKFNIKNAQAKANREALKVSAPFKVMGRSGKAQDLQVSGVPPLSLKLPLKSVNSWLHQCAKLNL